MIRAILFDFNGVIINDEPIQMRAYQNVLKTEGIDLTEQDYFASLGMDDRTFVRAAYQRAGKNLDDETLLRIVDQKTAAHAQMIEKELPLFPGIENFIKQMHFHYELGIVSMARRVEINYVLTRAGLADYFMAIISAEDVTACKPDTQCFDYGFRRLDEAAAKLGETPLARSEVLVIEDSPPGVVGAKNAGMKTLGVTNTVSEQELRRAGADAVTRNLADWIPETIELVFR